MIPAPVAVSGLAYEIGDLKPLESIEALRRSERSLISLRDKGVRRYAESELGPAAMAARAARRTLGITGVAPRDIDAVIYASTSFWEKRFTTEREISWLLFELGLENAHPVGVFLPGCANASISIRMAANLVRAEGYRHVLVATADKVAPEHPEKRVMWPDVSVLSDSAASCLVGAAGTGSFDVLRMAHRSSPAMWDLDADSNLAAFLMGTVKGARRTAHAVLSAAEVEPAAIRRLITNNYNEPVMRMMARQCGFAEEQAFLDNVPRFAHGYAADTLINLADCTAHEPAAPGDLYFLLGTGHKNWGAALLRKT